LVDKLEHTQLPLQSTRFSLLYQGFSTWRYWPLTPCLGYFLCTLQHPWLYHEMPAATPNLRLSQVSPDTVRFPGKKTDPGSETWV
jgi:hypothetical protein